MLFIILWAWVLHLKGDVDSSSKLFQKVEILANESDKEKQHIVDLWGIYYADYLRQIGYINNAREVAETNLKYAQSDNLEK